MKDGRILNIVDDNGKILGEDTRENIHRQGFLHREVHVWFYTPAGDIIFQHRAKDKDTFPDLLDITVGGHVEIGDDYKDSALKEVKEETGLTISDNDLRFIKFTHTRSSDPVTHSINNSLRAVYVYRYHGNIDDLQVEKGKSLGFESWPIDKILNISAEDKVRFIPAILQEDDLNILQQIKKLI